MNIGLFLEKVKFSVEEHSWGNKEQHDLKGTVEIGVGAELGTVLENSVCVYESMTFGVSKLPKEIQDKLIDVYKDIQKYFDENHQFNME